MDNIKTKEQARQQAIDWQNQFQNQPMCWSEIIKWQNYFSKLAKKFRLVKEFKENGII